MLNGAQPKHLQPFCCLLTRSTRFSWCCPLSVRLSMFWMESREEDYVRDRPRLLLLFMSGSTGVVQRHGHTRVVAYKKLPPCEHLRNAAILLLTRFCCFGHCCGC